MVVLGDDDQRKALYGGKVEPFVKRAGAHTAVADGSDGDKLLLLHARAQQNARHDGNHVAKVRDWTNKSFLHVAEVDIEIFSAGRSPRLRHVLREDVARSNSFYQYSAEVSDQRSDKILRLERIGAAESRGFLAE